MGNCLTCAVQDCAFADLDFAKLEIVDKIPFESHFTIHGNTLDFMAWTRETGLKGIIIDDHMADGTTRQSIMTSDVFKGHWPEMLRWFYGIEDKITNAGFEIIRKKIETLPWLTSLEDAIINRGSVYREAHFSLGEMSNSKLTLLWQDKSLHVSARTDKVADGCLATYRSKESWPDFSESVKKLREGMDLLGMPVKKVISELTIMDSNEAYDNIWINS